MSTINEIKEEITVVKSVGEFTNALQQIATLRMVRLREKVIQSRPFVETAHSILAELLGLRSQLDIDELIKIEKKSKSLLPKPKTDKRAVIVITSNQGLTGRYNIEIIQKVEKVIEAERDADFFIIGKKGQELFASGKFKVNSYPYEVKDDFVIDDLHRMIAMFDYYAHVTLIYSRFINTANRDVVALSVVTPEPEPVAPDIDPSNPVEVKKEGKYMYEPDMGTLIASVGKKLRAALFQQQLYDAHLSQFSAQMMGMKTASDNAVNLLDDLRVQYNKQRRKMIDKKISEVFAGSALW